ncbi:BrxA family protein [Bradyrhizobium japonicum]|uniref:BrxA family protein n=1 Tax=Bradyrhizobium japonicum TaxID=375 RepID=UPI0004AE706D|nr:BrxA family protein [Bradyrhizobium japonicum]
MKMRPEWSQRLLRKGVLVQETYQVFAAWDDGLSVAENLDSGLSGKHATAGWEREINSTLKRRLRDFERVRPLIALARGGMSVTDWRDCLRLWIGTTEQPFHDFATGWLFNEHEKGRYQMRSEDVRPFFEKAAAGRGPKAKPFSEYGQLRGARDLLRTAVDLGMLSGDGPTKTFASIAMSDDVMMFYAHMISDLESNTTKMLSSRLWRLAYMAPTDVHVALLRLHQYKRLNYEVAGNIAQVGLPFKSALECAERVAA